jgi:pimeloyl-ACP methyl ester carboxylesterase
VIDLRFEVAGDGGGHLTQAAWCFLPPGAVEVVGLLVCLAGGTYDKHYWHLEVPGHEGYSFAEHLAALGWVVVAVDHLGVGESSDPPNDPLGLEVLRDGDVEVAQQLRTSFADGTLVDGLAPLPHLPIIGVGHSMGACLTTMVQAASSVYDGVALLGYGVEINVRELADGDLADRMARSEVAFRQMTGASEGRFHLVPRDLLRPLFHSADVPDAVIAADDAVQSRVPVRAASEVTTPGYVAPHAALIDVPVLLGFGGDLDVSPDPRGEPARYPRCTDITLVVLDGSAHCHNMASRRAELWDRVAAWAGTVRP